MDRILSVVVDTTVISNFARTGSITELCDSLDDPPAVTRAVILETRRGQKDGYKFLENALDLMPPAKESSTAESYRFTKVSSVTRQEYDDSNIEAVRETMSFPPHVVVDEKAVENFLSRCLNELDWGEATVLQAGFERQLPVATDDGDARDLATDFGFNLTGSLGLLARCVKKGIVDTETANEWLSVWIEENGYYSPVADIEEVLS